MIGHDHGGARVLDTPDGIRYLAVAGPFVHGLEGGVQFVGVQKFVRERDQSVRPVIDEVNENAIVRSTARETVCSHTADGDRFGGGGYVPPNGYRRSLRPRKSEFVKRSFRSNEVTFTLSNKVGVIAVKRVLRPRSKRFNENADDRVP